MQSSKTSKLPDNGVISTSYNESPLGKGLTLLLSQINKIEADLGPKKKSPSVEEIYARDLLAAVKKLCKLLNVGFLPKFDNQKVPSLISLLIPIGKLNSAMNKNEELLSSREGLIIAQLEKSIPDIIKKEVKENFKELEPNALFNKIKSSIIQQLKSEHGPDKYKNTSLNIYKDQVAVDLIENIINYQIYYHYLNLKDNKKPDEKKLIKHFLKNFNMDSVRIALLDQQKSTFSIKITHESTFQMATSLLKILKQLPSEIENSIPFFNVEFIKELSSNIGKLSHLLPVVPKEIKMREEEPFSFDIIYGKYSPDYVNAAAEYKKIITQLKKQIQDEIAYYLSFYANTPHAKSELNKAASLQKYVENKIKEFDTEINSCFTFSNESMSTLPDSPEIKLAKTEARIGEIRGCLSRTQDLIAKLNAFKTNIVNNTLKVSELLGKGTSSQLEKQGREEGLNTTYLNEPLPEMVFGFLANEIVTISIKTSIINSIDSSLSYIDSLKVKITDEMEKLELLHQELMDQLEKLRSTAEKQESGPGELLEENKKSEKTSIELTRSVPDTAPRNDEKSLKLEEGDIKQQHKQVKIETNKNIPELITALSAAKTCLEKNHTRISFSKLKNELARYSIDSFESLLQILGEPNTGWKVSKLSRNKASKKLKKRNELLKLIENKIVQLKTILVENTALEIVRNLYLEYNDLISKHRYNVDNSSIHAQAERSLRTKIREAGDRLNSSEFGQNSDTIKSCNIQLQQLNELIEYNRKLIAAHKKLIQYKKVLGKLDSRHNESRKTMSFHEEQDTIISKLSSKLADLSLPPFTGNIGDVKSTENQLALVSRVTLVRDSLLNDLEARKIENTKLKEELLHLKQLSEQKAQRKNEKRINRRKTSVEEYTTKLKEYINKRNVIFNQDEILKNQFDRANDFIELLLLRLQEFYKSGDSKAVLSYISLHAQEFVGQNLNPILDDIVNTISGSGKGRVESKPIPKTLYDKIEVMRQYGNTLLDESKNENLNDRAKGQVAVDLADELESKARTFYNSGNGEDNFESFKDQFCNVLHSQDNIMSAHRAYWKVIVANIAIAVTVLGAIALGIYAVYSKMKNGQSSILFDKTNRQNQIDDIEKHVHLMHPNRIKSK